MPTLCSLLLDVCQLCEIAIQNLFIDGKHWNIYLGEILVNTNKISNVVFWTLFLKSFGLGNGYTIRFMVVHRVRTFPPSERALQTKPL